MSSFVISKKEYVKVAGFVAALVEAKNQYHESLVWLYNTRLGRTYNKQDIYDRFVKMYKDNAKSVQLQYHDAQPAHDDAEYKADFEYAFAYSKDLYNRLTWGSDGARKEFKTMVARFIQFAACVHYQIEDEKIAKRTNPFLNKIVKELTKIMLHYDGISDEGWSEFEIGA